MRATSLPASRAVAATVALASLLVAAGCGQSSGGVEVPCGPPPCCGDPPHSCAPIPSASDPNVGFIVIEQLPHDDCVLMLDGWPWRGPVALKARANVPAGRHRVECRNATGAATFTRELEVAAQRETPVYWGP